MLVSLTITMIMMLAVVTLFQVMTDSVSGSRALMETSDRLRACRNRIQADLQGATRLDLALRAFASGLQAQHGPPISVIAVRLIEGDIDVLLDEPAAAAPEGFESTGNQFTRFGHHCCRCSR